jgi:2-keto-4-pentenoate hydratase/2-oxohepta-3-ene-1,7-dioic acid hydratase in catechol pathway
MRLVTICYQGQEQIGALTDADTRVVRLHACEQLRHGHPHAHLTDMLAFLRGGAAARDTAQSALEFASSERPDGIVLDRASVEGLSPVPVPVSIRDFMAFEQHIINCLRTMAMPRWMGLFDEWLDNTFGRRATLAYRLNRPWYERPIYYKGNRMSVVGDGAEVVIPSYTRRLDWELEFGIFLCSTGCNIPEERSREYIGGYTIFNDFSARDIQGREMRGRLGPAKGKDFDCGNAIGPVLVTPDEVPDPYNLVMKARLNGEEVSHGHSSGMHWTFEQMIAYVSRSETVYPGEFFGSGTATVPESGKNARGCGVEMGRFLESGDTIELEVERIGKLRNHVIAPG